MSEQSKSVGRSLNMRKNRSAKVTAPDVVEYLRAHPKFLARYPELFSDLTPPSYRKGRNILDMQYFIIDRLQRQIGEARDRENALLSACRANLSSQGRVHAAISAIIQCRSGDELIETVTTDFTNLLDVDVAVLRIEVTKELQLSNDGFNPGETTFARTTTLFPGVVDSLLGPDRDCLLRGNIVADDRIYGDTASLVRAEALLRLRIGGDCQVGLLALGSRDADRFHSGQGTELLSFLSTVLAVCIQACLE